MGDRRCLILILNGVYILMNPNVIKYIENRNSKADPAPYGVYPSSVREYGEAAVFMADDGAADILIAPAEAGFSGESFEAAGRTWTAAPLTHANADVLRSIFPFTAPVPVLSKPRTIGVGDRLGIAAPGHLRVFERYDAYPILAQQSIRELNLTNRSFENVLDCASFAVFREGFTRGFGADGDHLKTPKEVEYAISCGYTMITLDCSEHIRNDVNAMTDEQVAAEYVGSPALEKKYLDGSFNVEGHVITFNEQDFRRICLIYNDAIDFAVSIYNRFFCGGQTPLDFEISIDETATPTTPEQHFYVANELISRGVKPTTIAPRFCGEFQKGVDYRGDLKQFEKELAVHTAIARSFGYKISVHSGSDKFSVFALVGKYTQGIFHVKTAGTSWLEAMAVIAEHDPALYREIHAYALNDAFSEACKYYHVTTDLNKIPALSTLTDEELPSLFKQDDARQLIHITYGLILNATNPDGSDRFRSRLYSAWRKYANEYADRLDKHIGKHAQLLYSGFSK